MQTIEKVKEVFEHLSNGWKLRDKNLPSLLAERSIKLSLAGLFRELKYDSKKKKAGEPYDFQNYTFCEMEIVHGDNSPICSRILEKTTSLPLKFNEDSHSACSKAAEKALSVPFTNRELIDAKLAAMLLRFLITSPIITSILHILVQARLNKKRSAEKMMIVHHTEKHKAYEFVHFTFKSQDELKKKFEEFARKSFEQNGVIMSELYLDVVEGEHVDSEWTRSPVFVTSIFHSDNRR